MKLYLTFEGYDSKEHKVCVYGDHDSLIQLSRLCQRNTFCSNVGIVEDKKEDIKESNSDLPF